MNKKTLIVLSLLSLLTVSCKKDSKDATTTSSTPTTKSVLSAWNYTSAHQVNFTFSSGNTNGVTFDTGWSVDVGLSSRYDCDCQTQLNGTSSAGTIALSFCSVIGTSTSTKITACNNLQTSMSSGVAHYSVNSSSQLVITKDNGAPYLNGLFL